MTQMTMGGANTYKLEKMPEIVPEYQAKGAALLMFKYLHENYLRLGIKRLLLNPQLEDNHKVQSLFSGYDVHPYQRRRSYVKAL